MMMRVLMYALGMLALLIAVFVVVVMIGMAIYGIAIVRSYMFGLFAGACIVIGAPAALGTAIWLGPRPRSDA